MSSDCSTKAAIVTPPVHFVSLRFIRLIVIVIEYNTVHVVIYQEMFEVTRTLVSYYQLLKVH